MNTKTWLKMSLENMMYGESSEYLEVGKVPNRTNKYIEEVKQYCRDEGLEPTEQNLYDAAEEELRDDFHNCGGTVLCRIMDIHCIYHHLPDYREELLNFITNELEHEFKLCS